MGHCYVVAVPHVPDPGPFPGAGLQTHLDGRLGNGALGLEPDALVGDLDEEYGPAVDLLGPYLEIDARPGLAAAAASPQAPRSRR